jgi:hypothetical protein
MVARIDTQVFHHKLCTPERDPFDSEGVQLAVITARGLEGEGDFAGALRWIRRAVREAQRQGNFVRAEDLERIASELAEKAGAEEERRLAPSSVRSSNANDDHAMQLVRSKLRAAPFAESAAPRSERSGAAPALHPTGSVPPLLAALISSMPPFSSRASAEIPPPAATPSQHMPLPALPPPAAPSEPWSQCPNTESRQDAASAGAANDNIDTGWPVEPTDSMVADKPVHAVDVGVAVVTPANTVPEPASVAVVPPAPHSAAERPSRVSVFRAAIPVSDQRTSSFFIQQLACGQRAPTGMVEAMIVVTGESDSTIGFEATLGVAKGTAS